MGAMFVLIGEVLLSAQVFLGRKVSESYIGSMLALDLDRSRCGSPTYMAADFARSGTVAAVRSRPSDVPARSVLGARSPR
jgi:hypothetical protein